MIELEIISAIEGIYKLIKKLRESGRLADEGKRDLKDINEKLDYLTGEMLSLCKKSRKLVGYKELHDQLIDISDKSQELKESIDKNLKERDIPKKREHIEAAINLIYQITDGPLDKISTFILENYSFLKEDQKINKPITTTLENVGEIEKNLKAAEKGDATLHDVDKEESNDIHRKASKLIKYLDNKIEYISKELKTTADKLEGKLGGGE